MLSVSEIDNSSLPVLSENTWKSIIEAGSVVMTFSNCLPFGARISRNLWWPGGKAYTKVVGGTRTETLMSLITRKIAPDNVVYTDCYRSYNLLDVNHFYHERINHSTLFVQSKNHINGIENFWNQAKRVLRKYNGILKESFPLFLKECEFRFNYGTPKIMEHLNNN